MPESKEPKLEAQKEVGPETSEVSAEESTDVSAEPALEESERENAAVAAEIETAESEKGEPEKHKKSRKVRHFNPRETKREEVLAGLPLATFKQRFIAYSVDLLIVLILVSAVATLVTFVLVYSLHLQPGPVETTNAATTLHAGKTNIQVKLPGDPETEKMVEFIQVIFVLIYFGLSVWLTNGLTLGKRIMRIRVVSLTHEHITLWQSCERALGYGASALECFFGFFQYFIYPNRTCVHDRIAETIVVQDPRVKKSKKARAK
jgi:uncharacterized RDD family membrane protein YckC